MHRSTKSYTLRMAGLLTIVLAGAAPCARADVLTFDTTGHEFISGSANEGSVSNVDGGRSVGNTGYGVGTNRTILNDGSHQEWRAFFTFDLSTLDLTGKEVVSATLQVRHFGYYSPSPDEAIGVFDISTDAYTLNHFSGYDDAIFNDLGSGKLYGLAKVTPGESTDVVSFNLNGAALDDIRTADGGFFSVGAAMLGLDGPYRRLMFGGSWDVSGDFGPNPPLYDVGVHRLIIQTAAAPISAPASAPEPSVQALLAVGEWVLIRRRQRL